MNWVLMPLRRYADFEGRSRRTEYWAFAIAQVILTSIFLVLIFAAGMSAQFTDLGSASALGIGTGMILLFMVAGAVVLALLIPNIAVQVRRFHDQGLTGWLVLLNLVPYVGSLMVFVMMLLPGKDGPNRFGPDPRAVEAPLATDRGIG